SKEDQDEEPSGEMSAAERTKMWDKIGLHKQISGFFSSLVTALIAAGPQIVLVLLIYPRYIMPFPSAQGNFTIINDLFAAIWLFLDVGTSQALVTYFSKHRVERPEKAVHYIQIYIFWQLTTGILQFGVITILGLYYFPTNAQFAHLSYNFIIHSMVQFPGFLMVNILVLRALQRTDLEQIASLLSSFVFKIVIQYACVLLFRQLFENNVRFGEIFGALIGLNVGTWIGGFADYLFAGYLFKKAGYERKMFFRWDFTKEELKEVLVYGIRLVAGNVWVPAVAGLQAILLATHVEDYSSEMAYYQLALTIGQVVALVSMLTNSLQSPISESFTFKEEHGKEKYLARVYTSSFKWVNFINLFLISTLFVLGWRIIITFSGPTWTRATFYLNMVLVFQLLGAYSWIGDKFMLGCNKTKTIMWIWIVEQGVRALGLLIFIPRFGMAGVLFAYIPGLLSKDILLIVAIRKKIIAPKWHLWRIWGIPIVSALINYGLFELFARALWQNDILTTLVLFFLGIFGFINLFAVLTAWLGGWDETELMELKLARDIAPKKLSIILRMLYASVDFGLGLKSPFKGKFPIELWEESQKEMNELQDLKKELQL
ncbi:MAG TPA: polysaccharide biosynthesis C-terminal domain-containing protein, partial [Patescibacteria group bacterium]|nr:polysaccharide biosynthesis C-terminal domain-containing protein [Patescibacteria group bacterium]